MCKLLELDKNTWNHTTAYKVFEFDKNIVVVSVLGCKQLRVC